MSVLINMVEAATVNFCWYSFYPINLGILWVKNQLTLISQTNNNFIVAKYIIQGVSKCIHIIFVHNRYSFHLKANGTHFMIKNKYLNDVKESIYLNGTLFSGFRMLFFKNSYQDLSWQNFCSFFFKAKWSQAPSIEFMLLPISLSLSLFLFENK